MSEFNMSNKVVGWFIRGHATINSWVAQITGKSEVFSYAREDIPANGGVHYLHKAGEVPQGEKIWFLPDGFYEMYLVSQKGEQLQAYGRYGRIKDGQLLPLTKEEVVRWIQS